MARLDRFSEPTRAEEISECSTCLADVVETDQWGRCSECAGNNLGVLCESCQDEWATVAVPQFHESMMLKGRKMLCDTCNQGKE